MADFASLTWASRLSTLGAAAIMAGASGYVLKQIRGTDLVDAVRRVAQGQSLLDPAVTQRVLERIRHGVEQPR